MKEATLQKTILSALSLFAFGLSTSCKSRADDFTPETIIGMERTALDRWGKGDPQGYLEIYAQEVTYFDPMLEKRADGLEAMRKYYAPITGKIKVDRYDMIDPKVQRHGDVAALSYNLISYGKEPDGKKTVLARWNSTKVYTRIEGQWKIFHDHWSYIKPDLKQPSGE